MAIPKSGYFIPNKYARTYLLSLQDVMGKNGVSAILNLAGLEAWADAYPADNLERGVDFADFSAIHAALEEMYGPRGGHGLERRAGWTTYDILLRSYRPVAGISGLLGRLLPGSTRVRYGLRMIARAFSHVSDQHCTVGEDEEAFVYTVHRCPVCWGRLSERPMCYTSIGLLEQSLRRLSGGQEFHVQETRCIARSDPACEFRITKQPIG